MQSFKLLAVVIGVANGALVQRHHTEHPEPFVSVLPSEPVLTPTEHGMGLLAEPTHHPSSTSLDRSQVFRSYNQPPVLRPGDKPPWSWVSDGEDEDVLPRSVDWRSRWGVNWITSIQDQKQCGTCWAFAVTALIESVTRIQHGFWDKRSESDLFESSQRGCDSGWSMHAALQLMTEDGHGLSDAMCNIYYDYDRPYLGCGDRPGRALQFGNYTQLRRIEDEKWWLADVGPIACSMDIYHDFRSWKPGNGPYHAHPKKGEVPGGHAMLVVGYNDEEQYWILKNSWGLDDGHGGILGDNGFWNVGYGECDIDAEPKWGVTNVDPDQWYQRRHRNGNIVQSSNGTTHRDIQVLRTLSDGNLTLIQRSGDGKRTSWSAVYSFIDLTAITDEKHHVLEYNATIGHPEGQPVLLETSFTRQRELVYWNKEKLTIAHWYESQIEDDWFATAPVGTKYFTEEGHGNITGYPGFIENDDSNFTIVAKTTDTNDSSLTEYNSNVDIGDWNAVRFVTSSGVLQSGPALVQSNVGLNLKDKSSAGNLYVVAVMKTNQMQLFWRGANETDLKSWHSGEVFGEGIPDTPPVMIQDFWNTEYEYSIGGFQLLVAKNGYVEHWQRINDDIVEHPPVEGQQGKWKNVGRFGEGNVKHVWGLVQGSFNFALEAVVEDNDGELWYWEYTGEWKCGEKLPSGSEDEKDAENWNNDSGYGTDE